MSAINPPGPGSSSRCGLRRRSRQPPWPANLILLSEATADRWPVSLTLIRRPLRSGSRAHTSKAGDSGQPALPAAVEFDVAVVFAAGGGEAEVEFLDVLVLAQRRGGAVHHHPAVLQNVAVSGVAQRD